ncbi:serine protease [Methylobacterium sp. J-026]|uniref:serine protease n=1 Tax=Methylobacterium sp. J-026 TaxID=2836624 RepID=UPI001FB96B17|nr:serine protease [Methylobacterium sp. J-026]MCJ2135653.1 serine protease [Methylobacterium sp. J-026]
MDSGGSWLDGIRGATVLLAGLLAAAQAQAQAQARPVPPRAAPAAGAPVDPAFEAAKAGFEALPEAERRAVQEALVWTGDFNAVVSGAFGRRTFEALDAYRTRAGGADPLDPRGRAALLAAGAAARAAARFRVAVDPGSGAVMGVPERLLAKRTALPSGTRWQSQDGRVTLETRAYPPGTETLDSLFEKATAPLPSRKVTYRLRRPDSVVVTAETGTGRSYIRYAAGPAGVRGFLFGYDRALAPEVDRLVIAVANAFAPFPEAAAVPTDPGAATARPAPARPEAGPAPAQEVSSAGAGLTVAPGRVLTAAAVLEGCAAPRIGGAPARTLAADPAGLALLDAPGAPAPLRPAGRVEPVGTEDGLIALAPGPDGIGAAPGSAAGGDVIAALQPGSAGAPVLDRSGRLVGLVARYPAAPRRVAGIVPPARLPLVPVRAIGPFLAAQGIAEAKPLQDGGPGAVARAVVGIACR